ncbi:MAG TPA: glycosyltransferase family 39 protein [Candidatus Acidoferrum sp.]|nr:glycosyltransferase family 39 protein [Candidatus Acidoferrum sp.]
MTETDHLTSEKTAPNIAARIAWAALIVVTLAVCYFSNLGAIGFVGPDEPRYAWIARDMAETGDWVTPRLYGKPWFEKPVLYYWMAAASFKLFGVSEAAARLPSALCALFATLALAWLAWRVYGEETARWLLVLLPTSAGMIGFSHAAATDMPFSGMLTIAMVCAEVVLGLTRGENTPILPRTPWLALLLFGFFLGLAVLAKGPAAIILSGGAVFVWALIAKKWRGAFRLLHPVAIATFCATALPWYILCARRNPDFFRVFIIEHNFKRYLTPEFQHIQPFWYYVPVVLIAFLPWSAALLWAAFAQGRTFLALRKISEVSLFFFCWAAFCLVFFSASRSKLPGYVLPAFPAVAALLSVTLSNARGRKSLGYVLASCALLLFLLLLPLRLALHETSKAWPIVFYCYAAILFALATANAAFALSELLPANSGLRIALRGTSILVVLLPVLFAGRLARGLIVWDFSGRTLANELILRNIPADTLSVRSMNRGQLFSLNFYLRREIPLVQQGDLREGKMLIRSSVCERLGGNQWETRELPFDTQKTGWFLCEVRRRASAPGASGSGQPR